MNDDRRPSEDVPSLVLHSPRRPAPKTRSDVSASELLDASDTVLVVAIGRYQADALAEAYRRHASVVFGLARRLLNDNAFAEEIVQEIFLRLWNTPENFDPDRGSLRSFLLAQCHGRSVDLLRSETSRRQREERDLRRTAEAGYDLEREVVDLSVAEQVRRAVAALPVGERQAIELAYLQGHTYREVAKILDQPEGTVKSRIRSGLQRLREDLSSGRWGPLQ